jgi:hypothetical protein
MKTLLIGLVLITSTVAAKLPEAEANKLVDAIYKIEGGTKTKYPYGIKSIPIKGNTEAEKLAYARKICWNTVQNQHDRWLKAGKPGFYVDFLANRYCPPSADKQGNTNWKANVRKLWGEQ